MGERKEKRENGGRKTKLRTGTRKKEERDVDPRPVRQLFLFWNGKGLGWRPGIQLTLPLT